MKDEKINLILKLLLLSTRRVLFFLGNRYKTKRTSKKIKFKDIKLNKKGLKTMNDCNLIYFIISANNYLWNDMLKNEYFIFLKFKIN